MSGFLNDTDFENYRNLIYDSSGIHFSASNRTILESRLKERLRKKELETPGAYFELIRRDSEELKVLLDSVTTNLTRFFRNTAHMQTFEYYVIPDLVSHKKAGTDKTIRLWSAGCSTGEEPYTLAMLLTETLPPGFNFEIIASDLSLKSLMTAKEGYYPDSRLNGIPDKYLSRYFDKTPGGAQIKPEIKAKVRFDYHNLKYESGLKSLDIVFCRNVIIYFDEVAQEAVINKFWTSMNNHSYLFIGHSESLFGMKTQFEFLKTDWACIYRKFV
ncbi:MAG: protein-glutamate O-methyltransferase CheR [Spirochaetales bacterium]|nr:protein-glutamate O-methyltransferase CheR [Spirochaetales bacterium]